MTKRILFPQFLHKAQQWHFLVYFNNILYTNFIFQYTSIYAPGFEAVRATFCRITAEYHVIRIPLSFPFQPGLARFAVICTAQTHVKIL
jgi:hypothetical protein